MQLTIVFNDVVVPIEIVPQATGKQLKEAIYSMLGLIPAQQELLANGNVISDQSQLSQYSLNDDDLIFVNLVQPQTPQAQPNVNPGPLNYDPQQVAQLSSQLTSLFQQGQPAAPSVPASPVSGPITPQLFQQMLANVTNTPQPVQHQNPDEPGPEQVWEHFRTHPEALEQLLITNPPLANAILSDDMQTLGQILEQIYKARRDTNARRAADINRLNENPFDEELQKKIEEEIRMEVVNRNMEEAMEHNPEAFGSVIMLYIDCKVNNTPVKAFVDSGAQITLMSAQTAERCGIMQFLDRRFARTLVGVGSCQALGRIHIASLMLGNSVFVSSFTIVEDSSVDFLLGLDMLRKHRCVIDLEKNCLRVGDEEVPFLAEKDIPLKARGMNVPEELISNIMQQGFARDDVIQALIKFGGDSEAAVAHLLQKNAK